MSLLANGSTEVAARVAHCAAARIATQAANACRDITVKQWLATTAIALVYFLLLLTTLLQNVLGRLANVGGMTAWDYPSLLGLAMMCLVEAYCFLIAVNLAEVGARDAIVRHHRYVFAFVAAIAVGLPVLVALAYVLGPPCGCDEGPFRSALASALFFSSEFVLTGSLALAAYVKLNSARAARKAFHASELERLALDREVLASRLSIMQARVEPQFLQRTLAQVERLYDVAPSVAGTMLDSLIAYLRTALPQLREESSTLGREARLASAYLDVVCARAGSRLHHVFDVPAELSDEAFPPLVLMSLVQDALTAGIEHVPGGGRIEVRARANEGHLFVRVMDDGYAREPTEAIAALETRLRDMYGEEASVTHEPIGAQGVVVTVEVSLAARDHR